MFVLGFVLYGSTMLLPVFLQTMMGYTATLSGMVLSPGGLAVVFLMPLVGALLARVEARWLVACGLLISASGLFRMAGFNLETDFRTAMLARVVQSAGMAFLFVPINAMAFAFIPKPKTSYATGLVNLARNVGGSAGIALVTTLLARRSQFHQHSLVAHVTPDDPRWAEALAGIRQMLVSKGSSMPDSLGQAHRVVYGMVQRQAAMKAFVDAFWIMGAIFILMIPLLLLMRRQAPHKAGPESGVH